MQCCPSISLSLPFPTFQASLHTLKEASATCEQAFGGSGCFFGIVGFACQMLTTAHVDHAGSAQMLARDFSEARSRRCRFACKKQLEGECD